MIEGRFGDQGQIYFEIDLIGGDNFRFPVETMLDTGFTEYLAMNKQDVQSLDWPFVRQNILRTAQGETEFDVYTARVIIDDQEFEVPVFAGDEIQEILLGSRWLKLFVLSSHAKLILYLGEGTLNREQGTDKEYRDFCLFRKC